MTRIGMLAILAATIALVGCGSDSPPGSASDYRAFVGRELARWRRDFPAYSRPANLKIEIEEPDTDSASPSGSATYESTVRGEVTDGQKMTVTYRFETRHAYEDGKWVFEEGSVRTAAMEIVPSDALAEDYIRHRLEQEPTPIDGIATADPAGAR